MSHDMTPALAGKIAVSTVLIILAYGLLIVWVGRFLSWLSEKYPRLNATHEEYYGIEGYPETADDYDGAVDGTEPPRAA